ncbi:hypothetical protein EXIGLDRAFT_356421 [Exidia glandulosa HHB12029]|uniref:Galactose-binding like protein n=1 Tax=Exidia glandulosa HHB12029 TaxID=1314781 RepID=A0A165C9Z2_EXIGL|nr:hypothetical protein EXIGLDRAFT_356421 [Exidia glandulosa HHB12029]
MRVFFASIALITFCTAARAEATSLDDSDYNNLSYSPATVPAGLCESSQQYSASCAGQWWQEPATGNLNDTKTTHKTFGGGDKAPTLSFTFRGSNVTVYGVKSKNGARAIVKLDRLLRYINTTSIDGKYHVGRKLFSQSGLDPNVNHTVSIEFNTATYDKQSPGPDTHLRYLAIDVIRVDMPDPSDDPGDTEQDDNSSRSSSHTVQIALGTAGGISGAILFGARGHPSPHYNCHSLYTSPKQPQP